MTIVPELTDPVLIRRSCSAGANKARIVNSSELGLLPRAHGAIEIGSGVFFGHPAEVHVGERSQIGSSWQQIKAEWYLGDKTYSDDAAWNALGVVERLWPEAIDELLSTRVRAPARIAQFVDIGLTLGLCEPLARFDKVLTRIKCRQRAARTEAMVAATLVGLGYTPQFEPDVCSGYDDILVHVGSEPVFIEITAPEIPKDESQFVIESQRLSQLLHAEGYLVDVEIITHNLTPGITDEILKFVRNSSARRPNGRFELPRIALINFKEQGNVSIRYAKIATRAEKFLG